MDKSENQGQNIFLAAVLHSSRHYRLYSLYFVNNSLDTIEAMVVAAPGWKEKIPEGTILDDMEAGLVDNVGIRRYDGIPPKSCVELTTCFDWDFDWSSERYVMFTTHDREEHLTFCVEGSIAVGVKLGSLPILGESGYLCSGRSVFSCPRIESSLIER